MYGPPGAGFFVPAECPLLADQRHTVSAELPFLSVRFAFPRKRF
jgi:hypothetical protein